MGADAGPMNMMSDMRAKENVAKVATHPAGFGLYLFDYRSEFRAVHGARRQFGVLAQEVAEFDPSSVVREKDGYLRVDYAKLGIVLH
ncbi:tail fiber domain-containing protein [Aurantiacibacter aquimixticola]|uniref:Tail fiber domain-containing protein n=2 Tax=Aurantiacibacter aquimixticola TaxID=1958945 RepID=A0A419RUI7_9SPHN|nr:tail fiber domain-containing protein [Aurantiacibacter aquimixticola]